MVTTNLLLTMTNPTEDPLIDSIDDVRGLQDALDNSGTEVTANPSTDETTPTLSSVEIDGTKYVLPGGGEGGAVSQGDLTTERNAREAGDDVQTETITRAAQLVTFLTDQQNSAEPALIHFTVNVSDTFGGSTHTYAPGDLVYFAPKSVNGKIFGQVAEHTHGHEELSVLAGSFSISPNIIPNAAAVVRDFAFAAEDLDAAWLTSQGVNQLEIWMNNTAFHIVSPWTPSQDVRLTVNVNDTEARAIAIGSATIVPVRMVFRNSGTFVALKNNWLIIQDIGSGDSYDIGDDQPFQTMQLQPAGIPDDNMVSSVSLLLHNQQTTKTISGVALRIAGLPGTLDTATPITELIQGNGVLRFNFTTQQVSTIGNSITSTVEKLTADVTITYSDSTTSLTRLAFSVRDPNINAGVGSGLRPPTSTSLANEDRLVFIEPGATGILRYSTRTFAQLIDVIRSGMDAATSAAKGLMSAADKSKLDALPTNAALTTSLDGKQDNLPRLTANQIWQADNAGTVKASDVLLGDSVIRFGNPTDLGTNPVQENMILAFGRDPIKLYVPHFKELVLRDITGSDFRVGSYTWGGVHSGPLNPTGNPPAGRVYFTFNAFGSWPANSFYVSQGGGGFAALASNHAPEKWAPYATLAEATKSVTDANTVVLIAAGGSGVVQEVINDHWVLLSRPDEIRTIHSGAAIELNANKSHVQEVTLAENSVLSIINGEDGGTAVLRVSQDATGSRTLSFRGITGTAPTLSTTANALDLLFFHKIGTTWVYVASSLNVRGV